MSYRTLEIWQRARDVSGAIHKMTLTKLPRFEISSLILHPASRIHP